MDLGSLIGFWSGAETKSIIQSIQTGEITIASGASSNTATINAVNTRYAVCFFNGWRSADTSLASSQDYVRISLTDATTVTAQTGATNATDTRIARYTVVEFKPFAIRSIQNGTATISGANTSANATIAQINVAHTFVLHLGQSHSITQNDFNYNQGRVTLTDATTVTVTKDNGANPSLTVGFSVVEFSPFIVKSIQQITVSIAGSATTGDATISAVNDTAALLVWGGWNLHLFASNNPQRLPQVYRTSTTNVRAQRLNTSATSEDINCTVVEFESRWVKSRQAAQTAIPNSNASANATISSIDTSKSLLSWLGMNQSNANSGCEAAYPTAKINSSTQVTLERGGSPAMSVTTSWEVMEFV